MRVSFDGGEFNCDFEFDCEMDLDVEMYFDVDVDCLLLYTLYRPPG